MRYYTKILPFENTRRLTKIMAFRNLVVEYFNDCKFEMFEAVESNHARKLRIEINKSLYETHEMVNAAGISTRIIYDPPPIRRGIAGPVDVLLEMFNLPNLQLSPNVATDQLERAYGIYERNRRAAKMRLFNPFFYLARLLDLISEIPFILLGKIGFNRAKVETSSIGRIAKGVIQSVVFLAALFEVLDFLGVWDGIRNALFGRI